MTHEGRRVAVGRQQLEGMINSADTSLHITAEQQDRWREGGVGWVDGTDGQGNKRTCGEEIDKHGISVRRTQGDTHGGQRERKRQGKTSG